MRCRTSADAVVERGATIKRSDAIMASLRSNPARRLLSKQLDRHVLPVSGIIPDAAYHLAVLEDEAARPLRARMLRCVDLAQRTRNVEGVRICALGEYSCAGPPKRLKCRGGTRVIMKSHANRRGRRRTHAERAI